MFIASFFCYAVTIARDKEWVACCILFFFVFSGLVDVLLLHFCTFSRLSENYFSIKKQLTICLLNCSLFCVIVPTQTNNKYFCLQFVNCIYPLFIYLNTPQSQLSSYFMQSSWTKCLAQVGSPHPVSPHKQLVDAPDSTCAQVMQTKTEKVSSRWVHATEKECHELIDPLGMA